MGTYLTRRLSGAILLLAATLLSGRAWAQDPMSDPSVYAAQVLALTNVERTTRGLPALTGEARLARAATVHSEDMAAHGYFSHTGSDGSSPDRRIDAQGYNWSWWGENIALDFAAPQDVVNLFMNSSSHRANILSSNFTDLGIGVAFAPDPSGFTRVLVTQDFGRPLNGPPPPPPAGNLFVSATAVAFPATALHARALRSVLIRNTGRGTLSGTVGALYAPFQVVSGGGTFRLVAGATRLVTISFTPAARGRVSPETLAINSSGGSARITVSGSVR